MGGAARIRRMMMRARQPRAAGAIVQLLACAPNGSQPHLTIQGALGRLALMAADILCPQGALL